MKHYFIRRLGNYGVITVLVALALLAVLVLVNVGATLLPKRLSLLDSSYNQLYTLSETTEKKLSSLTESVTLYFLCNSGIEDTTLRTFLDRYADGSDRVTVKVVDPVENPTFTKTYTDVALSNYSVIVESKKRSLCIDYYDLYLWENEMLGILTAEEYASMAADATGSYLLSYYPTTQHFNGESKLTNALSYVTAERIPKVYVTTGHKETALGSDFREALKANAYEVTEGFSLLSAGGVPSDCDLLLVNNPRVDLSVDERTWIADYLASGGRLFLTTAAENTYTSVEATTETADGDAPVTEQTDSDFPNLLALLDEYGLSAVDGVVVEEDSSLSYSGYPVVLLPKVNKEHAITSGASGSTMVFYTAHGIRIREGATGVTALFTTSDKAYTADASSEDLYEKTEDSESGPFTLAVAAEHGKGKLVWFSSAYTLDDSVDSLVSGGNHAYAISACDYLSEKPDEIALPSVSLEEPKLVITGNTAIVLAAIFIGVIPFSILLGGLFFWLKRRRA